MSQVEGLQIPRITTFGNSSEVHIPSRSNPEGPIIQKLNELFTSRQSILDAGRHVLFSMPSLLPHHPEGSSVLWIGKKTNNEIEGWSNPGSWIDLANDGEFLSAMQHTVQSTAEAGNSVYFFFGWSPENKNPEPGLARRGGMTQIRHHYHIAPQLSPELSTTTLTVHPGLESEDRRILKIFMDYGSSIAHQNIPHLKDFSSHSHSWTQHNGVVNRHMHGFINLQDAIRQLVILHRSLHSEWKSTALSLYEKHKNEFVYRFDDEDVSLLLFPPVVSASICIPSPTDRGLMGISPEHPCDIWVSPFSPVSKTALVDGVWLDRKSR